MHKASIIIKREHYLIKVPSDNMNVPSQSLEVVISVLGAKVSRAEDVLDLPWNQQLFKLGWEAVASMWNVKISQH